MENLNKKILIVDDDKAFLWILRQSLESAGFSVSFAEDGENGLEMAEKEKPDLILLDILMPKMDGIEVAKGLKEKGIKLKIIFLTNLKDIEHMSQAVEITKETDYIVKTETPIDQIIVRVKDRLGIK